MLFHLIFKILLIVSVVVKREDKTRKRGSDLILVFFLQKRNNVKEQASF